MLAQLYEQAHEFMPVALSRTGPMMLVSAHRGRRWSAIEVPFIRFRRPKCTSRVSSCMQFSWRSS